MIKPTWLLLLLLSSQLLHGVLGDGGYDNCYYPEKHCCKLKCIIRDQLKYPSAGFEGPISGLDPNIVKPDLGDDGKPVYYPGYHPSIPDGGATFDMWFHDTYNTEKKEVELELSKYGDYWYFTDNAFFPIDDQLCGNQGYPHNYYFTMECHGWFQYRQGAQLWTRSDDDMWVFVNNKRVIDLGGVHPALSDSAALDSCSLVPGQYYPIDIFFAERHTVDSVFSFKANFPVGKTDILVPFAKLYPVPGWKYIQKANCEDIPVDFYKPDFPCSGEWQEGCTPFGKDIICDFPTPATCWELNTFMALRREFEVPHGFLDGTGQVGLLVDNDILKVYVNGYLLNSQPFIRDTCPGVTAEQILDIPPYILRPGTNLLAILVQDRGLESFFNGGLRVLSCPCEDSCEAQFKMCKFTFDGIWEVPTFDLDSTTNDQAFTPRIVYKDPTAPTVGIVNTNTLPQFVLEDGTLENIKDEPNVPGVQHFSDFQFKSYTIGPYSGIGHETFQGNQQYAKNKCVKINLTNWQELSGGNVVGNVNSGCPECCVVFRTK